MALLFGFNGPSDRERLLGLGDVDKREREAVEQAKARRAARDLATLVQTAFEDADFDTTPLRDLGVAR